MVDKHTAMALIEERAQGLMAEFPQFDDAEIAQLIQDELLNARRTEKEWTEWATAETVGRVRRTLALNAIRTERAAIRAERAAVEAAEREAAEERVRALARTIPARCPSCKRDSAPGAIRCRWCLKAI